MDYPHYYRLSTERGDKVFLAAYHCSPDEFIDKTLFVDHYNQACGNRTGIFLQITEATHLFAVQRRAFILGRKTSVNTILVVRPDWLEEYYVQPMKNNVSRLARAVATGRASSGPSLGGLLNALIEAVSDGPSHCDHCSGEAGRCSCSRGCALGDDSKCYPSHCEHCAGRNSACSCTHGCAPDPNSKCYGLHSMRCDLCGASQIRGPRYRCTSCSSYNICECCYQECINLNKHDGSHAFMEYTRVGAQPKLHPAAKGVHPEVADSEPSPEVPRSNDSEKTAEVGRESASCSGCADRRGFFYLKMSKEELKEYLGENYVSFRDILDLETLQRRVWDCYCDSVSSSELDQLLASIGVEILSGMAIEGRRRLAKEKFKAGPRPAAPEGTRCAFNVGDGVFLQNLKRGSLNGKKGTVIDTMDTPGRATVRLNDDDKEYSVKFENLTRVEAPEFVD